MAGPRRPKKSKSKTSSMQTNRSDNSNERESLGFDEQNGHDAGGVSIDTAPEPVPEVLEFAHELLIKAETILTRNLGGEFELHVGKEIQDKWNVSSTVFTNHTHLVMERETSGKLLPVQCLGPAEASNSPDIVPPSEAQMLVSTACATHSKLRAMSKAKDSYLVTAAIFRAGVVHLIRAEITQDYIHSLSSIEQADFDALNIEVSREYDLNDERDPGELVQRIIDVFTGHERRALGGVWELSSTAAGRLTEA